MVRRALLHLTQAEGGFILPIVLALFAIGMLAIAPTLGHGYTSLLANTTTESKAEELHAADSGVEEGLHWLTRSRAQDGLYVADNWATGPWVRSVPYVLNGKNVYVTIETYLPEQEENLFLITSRAEEPEGGGSTVLALVYAVPFVQIIEGPWSISDDYAGDVAVDGNLIIETGNTTVNGTVTVTGNLELGQGAEIVGDVSADGSVTLGQSAIIQCNILCTGGDLTLGQSGDIVPQSTDVEAEIHFLNSNHSLLSFANTATVTGNIFAAGDLTIQMFNPQNSITGDIVVDGNLTIDLSASNSKGSITGNLYATGDITILLSKDADIYGEVHYVEGRYFPSGSDNATWPAPDQYVDVDALRSVMPQPQLDCPLFPSNDAEIQIWEIS